MKPEIVLTEKQVLDQECRIEDDVAEGAASYAISRILAPTREQRALARSVTFAAIGWDRAHRAAPPFTCGDGTPKCHRCGGAIYLSAVGPGDDGENACDWKHVEHPADNHDAEACSMWRDHDRIHRERQVPLPPLSMEQARVAYIDPSGAVPNDDEIRRRAASLGASIRPPFGETPCVGHCDGTVEEHDRAWAAAELSSNPDSVEAREVFQEQNALQLAAKLFKLLRDYDLIEEHHNDDAKSVAILKYIACKMSREAPREVGALRREVLDPRNEVEELREDAKHCHEFLDRLGVIRGQIEEGGLVRYNVFGRLDSHATTVTVGPLLPGEA